MCSHDSFGEEQNTAQPLSPSYRPGCLEPQRSEIDSLHSHCLHWWFWVHSYFFPKFSSYLYYQLNSNKTQFLASSTMTLVMAESSFELKFIITEGIEQRTEMTRKVSISAFTVAQHPVHLHWLVTGPCSCLHLHFLLWFLSLFSFLSYPSGLFFPLHNFSWENLTQTSIHIE